MNKAKFHHDLINTALNLIGEKREREHWIHAVLMGSSFKHQLIAIGRDTGMTNPHEEVKTLVGMEIITCKGITGPQVYFFESAKDARIFRDDINQKIESGITWEAIIATVEHVKRFDQSQFEESETLTMEDLNVQKKAQE